MGSVETVNDTNVCLSHERWVWFSHSLYAYVCCTHKKVRLAARPPKDPGDLICGVYSVICHRVILNIRFPGLQGAIFKCFGKPGSSSTSGCDRCWYLFIRFNLQSFKYGMQAVPGRNSGKFYKGWGETQREDTAGWASQETRSKMNVSLKVY